MNTYVRKYRYVCLNLDLVSEDEVSNYGTVQQATARGKKQYSVEKLFLQYRTISTVVYIHIFFYITQKVYYPTSMMRKCQWKTCKNHKVTRSETYEVVLKVKLT